MHQVLYILSKGIATLNSRWAELRMCGSVNDSEPIEFVRGRFGIADHGWVFSLAIVSNESIRWKN